MDGGWMIDPNMKPCNLPQEVETAFREASTIEGAGYDPVLYCGSQVVAGINYMLICKQTLMTNPPADHMVNMVIHKPLNEKAAIVSITRLL